MGKIVGSAKKLHLRRHSGVIFAVIPKGKCEKWGPHATASRKPSGAFFCEITERKCKKATFAKACGHDFYTNSPRENTKKRVRTRPRLGSPRERFLSKLPSENAKKKMCEGTRARFLHKFPKENTKNRVRTRPRLGSPRE